MSFVALAIRVLQFEAQPYIASYVAPGQQGGVLKDVGDRLAGLYWSHPVYQDAAGGCRGEAGDQLEQSGLAATGRTDQGDKFAIVDGEIEVFQHRGGGKSLGYTLERDHSLSAKGRSMRDGWIASCSTRCVERCQFHTSASHG